MKILIFFILLTFTGYSQIETDKVAHFGCGFIASAGTTSFVLNHGNGKNEWFKSVGVGFSTSFILGVGKEFYDLHDYGVFNWKDVMWTTFGGVGGVSVKFSINRYEKKHLI